jgi:Lipase (class 3)
MYANTMIRVLLYAGIAFISVLLVVGSIVWAVMPKWMKAKRRDSSGTYYYEVLGKLDLKDSSVYDKIRECYCQILNVAREVYQSEISWPQWLASYVVVVIYRILLDKKVSSEDLDSMLSADGEEGVEPVRKEHLVSLLTRVKFAQWAYPFNKNYERLEECLRQEGYLLVKHSPTTAPGKVAYYIAVNQQTKTLMIVPRGSSAISDLLTNIAGIPISQELDDGRVIYSHAGFLTAANSLTEDCLELVERLVVTKGYKLELVGHSLGGAVSTLMGCMLLAQIPELNDTTRFHMWVYAPPPCLNAGASDMIEPYISTIVWNNDIVPTMSVANAALTFKMLAHIEEVQRLYHGHYFLWLRTSVRAVLTWLGVFQAPMALPELQLKRTTSNVIEHAKKLHKQRRASMTPHVHVPGKVICLWERRHLDRPTGEINGVRASGNTFAHLKFVIPTRDSLSNHFLEAYDDGMRRLLDQLGNNSEHRRSMFIKKFSIGDLGLEDDDLVSFADEASNNFNNSCYSFNNSFASFNHSHGSLNYDPATIIEETDTDIIGTDDMEDVDNYYASDVVGQRESLNSNISNHSSVTITSQKALRIPRARRVRLQLTPIDDSTFR